MTAKKKRPTSDRVPIGKKKKAAKPPAAPSFALDSRLPGRNTKF